MHLEINKLNVIILIKHNVLGPNIFMQDMLWMQVAQGWQELLDVFKGCLFFRFTLWAAVQLLLIFIVRIIVFLNYFVVIINSLNFLLEIAIFINILHHQVHFFIILVAVVVSRNIWMIEVPKMIESLSHLVLSLLWLYFFVNDLNSYLNVLLGLPVWVVYLPYWPMPEDSVYLLIKSISRLKLSLSSFLLHFHIKRFLLLLIVSNLLMTKFFGTDLENELVDIFILDPMTLTFLWEELPSVHEDGVVLLQLFDLGEIIRIKLLKLLDNILLKNSFPLGVFKFQNFFVDFLLHLKHSLLLCSFIDAINFLAKIPVKKLNCVKNG